MEGGYEVGDGEGLVMMGGWGWWWEDGGGLVWGQRKGEAACGGRGLGVVVAVVCDRCAELWGGDGTKTIISLARETVEPFVWPTFVGDLL